MIRLLLPASIRINPNVANELRIGSFPCLAHFEMLIPSEADEADNSKKLGVSGEKPEKFALQERL